MAISDAKLLYSATDDSLLEEGSDIYIIDAEGKLLNPHVKPNAVEVTDGSTLENVLKVVVTGTEGLVLDDNHRKHAQKNIHALTYDLLTGNDVYSDDQKAQARDNIGAISTQLPSTYSAENNLDVTTRQDVIKLIGNVTGVNTDAFVLSEKHNVSADATPEEKQIALDNHSTVLTEVDTRIAAAISTLLGTTLASKFEEINSAITSINEYLNTLKDKENEDGTKTLGIINQLQNSIDTHKDNTTGNPHAVTAENVGLGEVQNNSIAMQCTDTTLDIYFNYVPQEEGEESNDATES